MWWPIKWVKIMEKWLRILLWPLKFVKIRDKMANKKKMVKKIAGQYNW